jgi:hypothetical protein
MSLLSCFTFAYRARSTKQGEIDYYSRTRQRSIDESAIEFVRAEFAREGRDALFVLPSPDAASALSPSARILSNHVEFDTEAIISERRYRGKVRGRLYVIMPTRIAQSVKGPLLLKEFIDYRLDEWESHNFGSSTVFVQGGTSAPN